MSDESGRLLQRTVPLALLFAIGFGQAALAQTQNQPLNFGNNFFVTGDYVVAGAYGMATNFVTLPNGQSYAVGTINVPDQNQGVPNPGITGATSVPAGAQIVTALLYWQTVEKVGAPGSGQNGYFRPLLYKDSGGPLAPGYAMSGSNVSGSTPVSWSSGGCNTGSTGKIVRTYRADVTGGLPNDANGNPTPNGSFEIRLPSTSNNSTPLTLGATLVVIYRIPSGAGLANVPLNAIVIYDGDYSQSNTQLTMTQQLQGFYDADQNPVSRLTHIVGSGQNNKFQTVYLSSGTNSFVPLPSLYPNGLPTFPGYYGTWDNPTWTFTSASQNPSNPITEGSSTATTQVVPFVSNQGCVSWGAIIVSTTVKTPDHDGILDSWKTDQGYCDAAINNGMCSHTLADPGWVDLTGAGHGQQDVFLQYDYMCSSVTGPGSCDISTVIDHLSSVAAASGGNTTYTGTFSPNTIPVNTVVGLAGFTKPANNGQFTVVSCTSTQLVVNNPNGVAETNPGIATYANPGDQNYSFDPRLAIDPFDGLTAVRKVVAAYANHGVVLHANPGNAIEENQANITCTDSDPTCPFPNEPGTVGFRFGLENIKNSGIQKQTGIIGCTPGVDFPCDPVFQHGKKDSYHYALFSHGVGVPTWFLFDGSLSSVTQSGNIVKFTTKLPHGIAPIGLQTNYATATDAACPSGRVTVVNALTNPNLNGTFCVLSAPNATTATTFSIRVGGSPTNFTYTANAEPYLGVANGQVTDMSGFSDVAGQNLDVALGYGDWGPASNPASDGNKWQSKAGTFMHELGHNMGLTHGGTFYNKLGSNPPDYTPSFEVNCKSNVQTNMSYLFQFDLLQVPGAVNPDGSPLMVVDYSEDPPPSTPDLIPTLTESSPAGPGILNNLSYAKTAWFQLTSFAGGTPLSAHCDGTPLNGDPSTSYVSDFTNNFFWSNTNPPGITGEDIDFNGNSADVMHGHNEWEGTPAQPVVPLGPSPGLDLQQVSAIGTLSTNGAGGGHLSGGGGGGHLSGGGGGGHLSGGGGGGHLSGGGGAPIEITHKLVNSYARPPQGLTIVQEEASTRNIDLSWFAPTFGTVDHYNIYLSVAGGPFTFRASVPGSQTLYTDTVTCNLGGYRYRVTSVVNNDTPPPFQLESVPSNTVPASDQDPLTGCYVVTNFSSPASASGNSSVPITWTLTDDFYITPGTGWGNAQPGNPVTRLAANTLVAIGPLPNHCKTVGRTTLLLNGIAQSGAGSFSNFGNQFTFTWTTKSFCAGSYTFELDLDSTQAQTTSPPLVLK